MNFKRNQDTNLSICINSIHLNYRGKWRVVLSDGSVVRQQIPSRGAGISGHQNCDSGRSLGEGTEGVVRYDCQLQWRTLEIQELFYIQYFQHLCPCIFLCFTHFVLRVWSDSLKLEIFGYGHLSRCWMDCKQTRSRVNTIYFIGDDSLKIQHAIISQVFENDSHISLTLTYINRYMYYKYIILVYVIIDL